MAVGSLKNWLYAAREGKLKEIGKGQTPLKDMEMELARFKKVAQAGNRRVHRFVEFAKRRKQMGRIPNGVYTAEFRSEAVKLVVQEGLSVDQAAKRLSVPKSSLGNWVRASRSGELAKVGQGQRLPTEMEMARLRKE